MIEGVLDALLLFLKIAACLAIVLAAGLLAVISGRERRSAGRGPQPPAIAAGRVDAAT